jgi:hypothetical protein
MAASRPMKDPMRNLFTSRNPFMSLWLSSANKVMGAARGQATAATKRQVGSLQAQATKQIVDFWSGKAAAPARKKKKRR